MQQLQAARLSAVVGPLQACEGQVVRLERGGDASDGWSVRVIGAAGDEVAVHTTEEDAKLEL